MLKKKLKLKSSLKTTSTKGKEDVVPLCIHVTSEDRDLAQTLKKEGGYTQGAIFKKGLESTFRTLQRVRKTPRKRNSITAMLCWSKRNGYYINTVNSNSRDKKLIFIKKIEPITMNEYKVTYFGSVDARITNEISLYDNKIDTDILARFGHNLNVKERVKL